MGIDGRRDSAISKPTKRNMKSHENKNLKAYKHFLGYLEEYI